MSTPLTTSRIAVVGMFDGVHAGHRYLFHQLRTEAAPRGLTPVAVTFPNHPLSAIAPEKAPALISTAKEKEALIRAEGVEPIFMPFDDSLRKTSAYDFMLMLGEKHSVKAMLLGFNNRFGHNAPRNFNEYKALAHDADIELLLARELPTGSQTVCSSAIRTLLGNGNVEEAHRLLQRPYELTGTITHGRQIGRTIGFPTANITAFGRHKIIPAEGVYAAKAIIPGGQNVPAVVNIGHRPTVEHSSDAPLSVEAHLIGFDGDLYNRAVTLQFMARIREERRFPDLTSLKNAITDDLNATYAILNL